MTNNTDKKAEEDEVTQILIELKIFPKVTGFDYLRDAIKLCLTNSNLMRNITGKLYPILAQKYKVKINVVEKSIRFAIDRSYQTGGLLSLNQFYDTIVYKNGYSYSNCELITILVEKIRLDNERKNTLKSYINFY